MRITRFIFDLIRPANYFQADLRKSINIPGNTFSWKIQFRYRETKSIFFALMSFSSHFSFYLYTQSKASLASFICFACFVQYPSLFTYYLLPYVRNTSKVITPSKKRANYLFFYSFEINKIVHVQLNMRLGTQDCSLLWKVKQDQERCLPSAQRSPMLGNCWLGAWHSFDLCQAAHFSLTRSGHSSGVGGDQGPLPISSRGCS